MSQQTTPPLAQESRLMNTIILILLVLAFSLFFLAAIGMTSRINLVAAGLAVWVLTEILAHGILH
jgi:hypothetical protein